MVLFSMHGMMLIRACRSSTPHRVGGTMAATFCTCFLVKPVNKREEGEEGGGEGAPSSSSFREIG